MEILVYMDDDDKQRWFEITEEYNAVLVKVRANRHGLVQTELKQMTQLFWHDVIEKYPVLRNKQLNVDARNGTICCWTSAAELHR